MQQANTFPVRYIATDDVDLQYGDIYQAIELLDCSTMYGVLDRSGEWYAYPKALFQIIPDQSGAAPE